MKETVFITVANVQLVRVEFRMQYYYDDDNYYYYIILSLWYTKAVF